MFKIKNKQAYNLSCAGMHKECYAHWDIQEKEDWQVINYILICQGF